MVITGGAGFIGSHLAEELVGRGYYVIILDDLSTGMVENIADLLTKEKVKFVPRVELPTFLCFRSFSRAFIMSFT